jgi:hypothetical protein
VAYVSPPTATSPVWVDVTGGNTVLPNRPILDVSIKPNDPLVGWAAVGGFNENTPGTAGHVFQVTCTAQCASFTWVNKTGNLPNVPVDSIIANPNQPNQVYAGTDWGLYFTNDISVPSPVWSRFDNGLPHVMVWDLAIDRGATTLAVFTRSRGAYAARLPAGTTSVKVSSFTARRSNAGVTIVWSTVSETNTLGFNVWRSVNGKTTKVNRALIQAKVAGFGAAYRVIDRAARLGASYTYRLQVVRGDGTRFWAARAALHAR